MVIYISTFKENGLLTNLPYGELYRTNDCYSIYSDHPYGNNYTSEKVTMGAKRRVAKDGSAGIDVLEDYTYEATYYTSFLTPDELITLLLKLIKETSVTIENSEFFLNSPIVTSGVAKVILNNCVAHIEGGDGFVEINGAFEGGKIHDNYITSVKYHKYGSQNKKDLLMKKPYFPSNTEYHIKVNKEDTVIKSKTDKRGYPASCGVDNKGRDVIMIIRGEKQYTTVEEFQSLVADAKAKGEKEISITKQIRLSNDSTLKRD